MNYSPQRMSCLFSLLATFIVATVPALLIALWKIYRYTRYNVVAIVLISLTIAFCYGNIASFIYMTLTQPAMTFWRVVAWRRH